LEEKIRCILDEEKFQRMDEKLDEGNLRERVEVKVNSSLEKGYGKG
jgi:hypothetical protein